MSKLNRSIHQDKKRAPDVVFNNQVLAPRHMKYLKQRDSSIQKKTAENKTSSFSTTHVQTHKTSAAVFLLLALFLAALAAAALSFGGTAIKVYVLGGVIGIFVAVFVFRYPEWGAYLLIFSVFSNLSDLFTESGLPSINQPLIALVLVCILANHLLRTGRIMQLPRLTILEWSLLLYFAVIVLTVFIAADRWTALELIIRFAKDIVILFSVISALNTEKKLKTGFWVIMGTVSFLSLLGILQNISGNDQLTFLGLSKMSVLGQTTDTGESRYGGPMGLPNIWGQVLVAAFPLLLYRVLYEPKRWLRLAGILGGSFTLIAILLTNSRGAFVTLVVILPLIALEIRARFPTIMLAAGILLILVLLLPASYKKSLTNLSALFPTISESDITGDESVTGRTSTMLTGLAMFRDNPFLGVGVGNFGIRFWDYATDIGLESGLGYTETLAINRKPHSLYIEVLAETGLFGMLTFGSFFTLLIAALIRYRNDKVIRQSISALSTWLPASLMAILAYLISGTFLHGLLTFRFLWIIVGLTLSGLQISRNLPNKTRTTGLN